MYVHVLELNGDSHTNKYKVSYVNHATLLEKNVLITSNSVFFGWVIVLIRISKIKTSPYKLRLIMICGDW